MTATHSDAVDVEMVARHSFGRNGFEVFEKIISSVVKKMGLNCVKLGVIKFPGPRLSVFKLECLQGEQNNRIRG